MCSDIDNSGQKPSRRSCTRRDLLGRAGAAALSGLPGWHRAAAAQASDGLQDWLGAAAIPIRTVDANDADYSDLEPLVACIGSARVVQLGEPSHNAGSCFAMKARLVRFLHQRMGFGVVVWESGFFDVTLTDAALQAGEDPLAAARKGILANWASSEEVQPLFQHASASRRSDRPLRMAGFDMTLTSPFSSVAAQLRSYAALPGEAALRNEITQRIEEVIGAFAVLNAYVEALDEINAALIDTRGAARAEAMTAWERDVGAPLRPRRQHLERLQAATQTTMNLLEQQKTTLAAATTERQRGFIVRIIASLEGRAVNLYQRFGTDVDPVPDPVEQENRRDALNANNLRWLIEQGFPDQKLIIWAHNAHVMNAWYLGPDFTQVSLEPAQNAMKPHGVHLADMLGNALYTIGLSVHHGQDGWEGLQQAEVLPATPDSIEARLYRLGLDQAFLDLREARAAPDHPMQEPQTARVPKFAEVQLGNALAAYDGLLFIARLEPAHLIR